MTAPSQPIIVYKNIRYLLRAKHVPGFLAKDKKVTVITVIVTAFPF